MYPVRLVVAGDDWLFIIDVVEKNRLDGQTMPSMFLFVHRERAFIKLVRSIFFYLRTFGDKVIGQDCDDYPTKEYLATVFEMKGKTPS